MLLNPINTMVLVVKGLIVGIIASAPMGPVGVLAVRRTLNKGRWYGFVTGLGAVVSDLLYAILTALGMRAVMEFFSNSPSVDYFKLGGSIMLFLFGLYTYKARPHDVTSPSHSRGTLANNMLTGFLVSISNPLVIVLFIALFDSVGFIRPEYGLEYIFGFAAIVVGACLWWFCLSGAIDRVRMRFRLSSVVRLNRAIGILVMLAALAGFAYTLYYIWE